MVSRNERRRGLYDFCCLRVHVDDMVAPNLQHIMSYMTDCLFQLSYLALTLILTPYFFATTTH
jgi:hypothetical protein